MSETRGSALNQCIGKIRFDSIDTAQSVQKRRGKRGKRGAVYKCPHCHGWHIGSQLK